MTLAFPTGSGAIMRSKSAAFVFIDPFPPGEIARARSAGILGPLPEPPVAETVCYRRKREERERLRASRADVRRSVAALPMLATTNYQSVPWREPLPFPSPVAHLKSLSRGSSAQVSLYTTSTQSLTTAMTFHAGAGATGTAFHAGAGATGTAFHAGAGENVSPAAVLAVAAANAAAEKTTPETPAPGQTVGDRMAALFDEADGDGMFVTGPGCLALMLGPKHPRKKVKHETAPSLRRRDAIERSRRCFVDEALPATPASRPAGPAVDPEIVHTWMSSTLAAMQKQKSQRRSILARGPEDRQLTFEGNGSKPGSRGASKSSTQSGKVDSKSEFKAVVDEVDLEEEGLPTAAEVKANLDGVSGGPSESDLLRMQSVFKQFLVPDTYDIHKDSLCEILNQLGYLMVDEKFVQETADESTSYSTLDFGDFVEFCMTYASTERAKIREIFDQVDEDGSGEMDVEELHQFMISIGLTPLRSVVKEALDIVDRDGSGQLDFGELVHLIAIYRHTEGFSRGDAKVMRGNFDSELVMAGITLPENRKPGDGKLPLPRLEAFLLRFFGPLCATAVTALVTKVKEAMCKDEPDVMRFLEFKEALLIARRLREAQYKVYRKLFDEHDEDGGGSIDVAELQGLVKSLGYSMNKSAVSDLMKEADECGEEGEEGGNGELDFDEFVNLMEIVRRRDGFGHEETKQFKSVFMRFDSGGDDNIDTLELADVMRYLGHQTPLNEVTRLIDKVDFDRSGGLDFGEFLRLMRLHREDEMRTMETVYKLFATMPPKWTEMFTPRVPGTSMEEALAELGYEGEEESIDFEEEEDQPKVEEPPKEKGPNRFVAAAAKGRGLSATSRSDMEAEEEKAKVEEPPKEKGPNRFVAAVATARQGLSATRCWKSQLKAWLDLDDFVDVVDKRRASRVAMQRRCAGFSPSELANFRKMFKENDHEKKGVLGSKAVATLLTSLGFEMGTKKQREKVLKEIDKARTTAAEVGIENVGELGTGPVPFWVLVQLLRVLYSRDDKRVLDQEARIIEQTRFSQAEVSQFREVFLSWYEKDAVFKEEARMNAMSAAAQRASGANDPLKAEVKELTKDCMRRVLKSFGLVLQGENMETLNKKLNDFGKEEGRVDFMDFLLLFRWMLDIDFAGISGQAAKAAKDA